MLDVAQHIHFIGIGGIGMSGLARILLTHGKTVSGSDLKANIQTQALQSLGAHIYLEQSAANIQPEVECVVISTAISENNPELLRARMLNLPILHRSDVLRYLLEVSRGIAITGTHGKTTTSALMSLVLMEQQLDPTIVIGGQIPQLGTNAYAGSGDYTVAEVDESDQSLRKLTSEIVLITNLEVDHLDHYSGLDEILEAVLEFLTHQPSQGRIICNLDDAGVRRLLELMPAHYQQRCVGFGLTTADADYTATHIENLTRSSRFELMHRGVSLGQFEIGIPGTHNVYNAMSVLATVHDMGLDMPKAAQSLAAYQGVQRRFQLMGQMRDDISVIDDYAHHPSEIRATLQAARLQKKKITAVFQPHRYSRTQGLLNDFAQAFAEADRIIFTDIYAASENPLDFDITIQHLVHAAQVANPHKDVQFFSAFEDIARYVQTHQEPQSLVLTMGAGNISQLSQLLVGKLQASSASDALSDASALPSSSSPMAFSHDEVSCVKSVQFVS